MTAKDEFLLLSRSGNLAPREREGPDRWAQLYAEARPQRAAARVATRRTRRSRARLTVARSLRAIAATVEGAAADQLRPR